MTVMASNPGYNDNFMLSIPSKPIEEDTATNAITHKITCMYL